MTDSDRLPGNTRLALYSESNMHALVRRIPLDAPRQVPAATLEDMNELLMSKDVQGFVRAADRLGVMFRAEEVPARRRLSAEKARAAVGTRLLAPDADALLGECYFDPFSKAGENPGEFEETGRVAKAATKRAVAEFGLLADDAFICEGFEYVVEPLHDWVILRNMASIAMRLLANARVAAEEGTMGTLLADTGFSLVEPCSRHAKTAMGGPSFVIPVGYNPFFSRPALDLTWDDETIWPFYCGITEEPKSRLDKLTGAKRPRRLKGAEGVLFLTSVQVDRAEASLALKKSADDAGDKWLYMAVAADESGQEATANTFLRGLQGLFGTEEVVSCGGAKADEVKVSHSPSSLPEALWANVRSHPNRYLMSCRFCGRTVFANMLGGETSFCSPSCRSAYSQMLRKQGAQE